MTWHLPACLALAGFMAAPAADGLTLEIDYSNDAATDNFFGTNSVARAALEAAVANVQGWIDTTLNAVANDTAVGVNGETSATFNWSFTYLLPSGGGMRTIQTAAMPENTVRLYVGVRELTGDNVAQGAPGGAQVGLSGFGFGPEWAGAVSQAETLAEGFYSRDGGPTMGTLLGSAFLDGYPASYSIAHGATLGSFWFDVDTNDDTLADSPAQLASWWHFDHTTPVDAGKLDFYTVAQHEILHTLGFGSSQSWEDMRDGADWFGANAQALMGGSGAGLLEADGKHFAPNLSSPRLSDGLLQAPLMTALLSVGERRELTELDYAAMRDIGWTSPVSVPEPGVAAGVLAGLSLAFRRRRARGFRS